MNVGRTVLRSLEFSHELDLLHKYITHSQLPVQKSDSFDNQCILLEQYLGEDIFQSTYKKIKRVNILSGLFALPVLLIVAAFHSLLRRKLYGRIYPELKYKLQMNVI